MLRRGARYQCILLLEGLPTKWWAFALAATALSSNNGGESGGMNLHLDDIVDGHALEALTRLSILTNMSGRWLGGDTVCDEELLMYIMWRLPWQDRRPGVGDE